jgi:hypothetical protein
LKKRVESSQQDLLLVPRTFQGQPLLPKIPPQKPLLLPKVLQQSSPLSQQNLPQPQQNPPLLPLQQSSFLHSKISHPYEVHKYVEIPQDHYSFLHSETPEMNQFYSRDSYFNSDLTQFLMHDKKKEASLMTKV